MRTWRIWLSTVVHRPALAVHKRVESIKDELRSDFANLRDDVWRLEIRLAAWGATAAMLALCGLFLLMGCWFGLSHFVGPVGASFVLAALFGLLAVVPLVLLPRELARARHHFQPK